MCWKEDLLNDFQVREIKDHPWWSNEECSESMQQVVKKPWIERGASMQKIWGSRGRGLGLSMNGHHLLNYTYYSSGILALGIPVSVSSMSSLHKCGTQR
jgi:hypothetical protein